MTALVGLPEFRRREYLAALGVPLFAPRQPLPGALPSPIATRHTPVLLAVPASKLPMSATTCDLLNRPVAASRPTMAPVLVEPAVTSVAPAPSDIPRFACRLLRVTEQDFVLLDLGEFPDLGLREAQLWRAIVQAMDWRAEGLSADFAWPLSGGLLSQGADMAREMLAAWLGRDVPAQARLYVFGEAPAAHVRRPHRLLPSLAQLLASPLAKRQLWRELGGA